MIRQIDTAADNTPVCIFTPSSTRTLPQVKLSFGHRLVESVTVDGPFTEIKLEGWETPLRTWNPRDRYDLKRLLGRKIGYFEVGFVDRNGPKYKLKIGVEGQHWLSGGETRLAETRIDAIWEKVTKGEETPWVAFIEEPTDSPIVLEEGTIEL